VSAEARPIIANLGRLYDFMDRYRLAALVARSGQNFTYLSGIAYPGTLARHLDLPDSAGLPRVSLFGTPGSSASSSTTHTGSHHTAASARSSRKPGWLVSESVSSGRICRQRPGQRSAEHSPTCTWWTAPL
jgi:hypothetical protein